MNNVVREWQTEPSAFWRMVEMSVRYSIAVAWTFLLYASLTYFFPPAKENIWALIAMLGMLHYSLELAMPRRKIKDNND